MVLEKDLLNVVYTFRESLRIWIGYQAREQPHRLIRN